jgi:putative Mn2+ efflux pump MntP
LEFELINVIALAFALAFDAFAVAIAVGIRLGKLDKWTVFRLSFHFGFAQFGMPIIGWLIGEYISGVFGSYAKIIASIILLVLGGRLIWEQFRTEEHQWKGDPTRGISLLVLMFATSVDALAAGFTLALVGIQILYPTLIIGIVAASMTIIGLIFGRTLGIKFSKTAGIFGGILLIALAIKTVLL